MIEFDGEDNTRDQCDDGPLSDSPPKERQEARLRVLQALYEMECTGQSSQTTKQHFLNFPLSASTSRTFDRHFFQDLFEGTLVQVKDLDALIVPCLNEKWRFDRLEMILRLILRVGVYELKSYPSHSVAMVVACYVRLTQLFFNGKEPAFVHALLDALAHRIRKAPCHHDSQE